MKQYDGTFITLKPKTSIKWKQNFLWIAIFVYVFQWKMYRFFPTPLILEDITYITYVILEDITQLVPNLNPIK